MGTKIKTINQVFKNKSLVILIAIFVLGFLLRTWNLANIPDAIDEDEMALGYYSYSLLKNGTDEYGHKFPIYFESIGDYKYGVYSYVGIIPVAIFGLNPFSVRLTAAVSGSISIIVLYLLVKKIFSNEKIALLSSFVLAVNPTHIHFSRVAYNNILGLLFILLAIYFFICSFEDKSKIKNFILTFIFTLLAIYTYQAYRIILPGILFFILVFNVFRKLKDFRKYVIHAVFLVLIGLIVFVSLIPAESRARAQNKEDLLNSPMLQEQSIEDYLAGKPLFGRIFHNKYFGYVISSGQRVLSYFDPNFLFVESSIYTSRHAIPSVGVMNAIEAIFVLTGVFFYHKLVKSKFWYLPFLFILIPTFVSFVTTEERSTTRAVSFVVGYCIIAAIGMYYLVEIVKSVKLRRVLIGVLAFAYLANLIFVGHEYFIHKVYHHPWYSDVGLREMVDDVTNKYYQNYDKIVISGGHYIPFLFYNKTDPKVFLSEAKITPISETRWHRVSEFGKIVFNMPHCPTFGKEHVLYVCFGPKIPENTKIVDVIRYKDEQPAIILFEFIPFREEITQNLPDKVELVKYNPDPRYINGLLPSSYSGYW